MLGKNLNLDTIIKYLELITKFVAVMIVVATIVGALNIYSYLKDINHLFLFPDVVGISYASVSALVSYFIFVFLISIGFLSPFLLILPLSKLLNLSNQSIKNRENKSVVKKSLLNPRKRLLNVLKCEILLNSLKKIILTFLVSFIVLLLTIIIPLWPIILILFFIYFLIEELFFGKKRYLSYDILSKFVHNISFLHTLFIAFILFFGGDYIKNLLYLDMLFFIFFSFLYIILFFKNKNQAILSENFFFIILLLAIQIISPLLHYLFVVYPTLGIVEKNAIFIFSYILSIFIFGLSCFLSHISFSDFCQNKQINYTKKYDVVFTFAALTAIIIYAGYLSSFSNYNTSLHKPNFIEKPQNSSWYLIHNGNTTSQTINGFAKDDIKKQKQIFNAKDCGALNGESKEKCQNDNKEIFNQRHNALYGYMAWNLGNTKVFCPVSVDFFIADVENESLNQAKGTNEKKKEKSQILDEKSKKCLVIDGKYLQPISEHYLAN